MPKTDWITHYNASMTGVFIGATGFIRLWIVIGATLLGTIGICWAGHFPGPIDSPPPCDFYGKFCINGLAAQPGDEVAFFDPDGILCGHFVVDTVGQYGLLHVYTDDSITPEIDEGAQSGDQLTVRVWDESSDHEFFGDTIQLVAGQTAGSAQASPLPPEWRASVIFALDIRAGFSGDVNLDGRLDIADCILALQMLAAVNPDAFHATDDINGDERFGLAEAIAILQMISGLKNN